MRPAVVAPFVLCALAAWILGCSRGAAPVTPSLTLTALGRLAEELPRVDVFALAPADDGQPRLRVRGPDGTAAWRWEGAAFARADALVDAGPPVRSMLAGEDEVGLLALRGEPMSAGALLTVAGAPAGWAPQAAALPDGGLALVFDRSAHGDADVVLREPSGAETVVAGSAAFEGRASLAADGAERLWVAWERGAENWGRIPELHGAATIELAVRDGGGWRAAPGLADRLLRPDPTAEAGAPGAGPFVGAECPLLVADADGALWLFYRAMLGRDEDARESAARKVVWQQRVLVLTEGGWAGPLTLPDGDGPQQARLAALALRGGGVLAVYGTDRRRARAAAVQGWSESLTRPLELRGAVLRAPAGRPDPAAWPAHAIGRRAPAGPAPPVDPDPTLVAAGFVRLWGDLHRHTEWSRCKMDLDGTLHDQWRYALDHAALDFMAVTDHMQHVGASDLELQIEAVHAFDLPGRFSALYGVEAAIPSGHRNLITHDLASARALYGILLQGGNPALLLDGLPVLSIPHQLTDRQAPFRWREQVVEHERLVEIFQARRGSYESARGPRRALDVADGAAWAQDHLARGHRFGFVGSSDHQAVLSAYAAAIARGRDRASVFEALAARRCYAASAKIAVDVQLGPLAIGGEGPVAADAILRARIAAGAPLAWVEVVRGGEVVRAWQGAEDGTRLYLLRTGLAHSGTPELEIAVAGGRVERAAAWRCEAGDSVRVESDGLVRATCHADPTDEDGALLWIAPEMGNEIEFRVSAAGINGPAVTAEQLAEGTVAFRLGRGRASLEGGRPPLGAERLDLEYAPGDWAAGDWVYLRLKRVDGEVAWTSPFFITAE
jgi:hypothetical protein